MIDDGIMSVKKWEKKKNAVLKEKKEMSLSGIEPDISCVSGMRVANSPQRQGVR